LFLDCNRHYYYYHVSILVWAIIIIIIIKTKHQLSLGLFSPNALKIIIITTENHTK